MSSEIQQYIEDIKQFAKESEMFIVRCEKPDRKRTTIIYTRVPEDRLVLRNWIWSYGRHWLCHQATLHPHQQYHPQLICLHLHIAHLCDTVFNPCY
jgi:hypothetical protein